MPDIQRIVSTLEVDEEGMLHCACYSTRRTELIYSVRLMALRGNEFDLCGGRFRKFNRSAQAHPITIKKDQLQWPVGLSPIIEWIDEYNLDTWSMRGIPRDVANFALDFSFFSATDAAVFALRWR
jgi:hypothetical protein